MRFPIDQPDSIKPGDRVFVCGIGRDTLPRTETVSAATKLRIIVPAGKFRRRDGREVGSEGSFHWLRIEPYDETEAKQYAKARIRKANVSRLETVRWGTVSDETIAKLIAVLGDEGRRPEGTIR